ncbi:hypothetical protein [Aquimarina sp. I32.4]|uniref:hypothetical protein n=1 Tax=Aquimarina sp. I32.4 TaxID=2053903 RepID=UPI000CDEC611|nr:hypothetical protein [Aquimarina sp. I32.4]
MNIDIRLKLGLVNQYLDDQIQGIVKEAFDDAIRNEALDEIATKLEAILSVERTKMSLTIQTAYCGVFYSIDDIEQYVDAYVKKHLEREIKEYFKERKTLSPNDWIRNNKTGEYVWDENVTSATDPDLPHGYTYVGKGNKAIRTDFDKNAGWMDKVKDFMGSGGPRINISSYIAGKLSPKIENAFLRQRESNKRTTSGSYHLPNFTFHPIDFNVEKVGRLPSFIAENEYELTGAMDLGGRIIPYKAYYVVRNDDNHLVNSISYERNFVTGGGHRIYKNAFIFKGSTKMVVVVSLGDEETVKYVKDFTWNF